MKKTNIFWMEKFPRVWVFFPFKTHKHRNFSTQKIMLLLFIQTNTHERTHASSAARTEFEEAEEKLGVVETGMWHGKKLNLTFSFDRLKLRRAKIDELEVSSEPRWKPRKVLMGRFRTGPNTEQFVLFRENFSHFQEHVSKNCAAESLCSGFSSRYTLETKLFAFVSVRFCQLLPRDLLVSIVSFCGYQVQMRRQIYVHNKVFFKQRHRCVLLHKMVGCTGLNIHINRSYKLRVNW